MKTVMEFPTALPTKVLSSSDTNVFVPYTGATTNVNLGSYGIESLYHYTKIFVVGEVGTTDFVYIDYRSVPMISVGSSPDIGGFHFNKATKLWDYYEYAIPSGFGLVPFKVNEISLIDSKKIYLGTGSDAVIYYDGTNLIIDPKAVGSGVLDLNGGSISCGGLSVLSGTAVLGTVSSAVDFYIHNGGGIWVYESGDNFLCSAVCKDGAAEWQFNDDVNIGTEAANESLYVWGNVGIGIGTPNYKLDVQGSATTDKINSYMGFNIYPVPIPEAASGVLNSGDELEIGRYRYYITYLTDLGESSNSSRFYIDTTAGNQRVLLTIPVSTDNRVTGRQLFRTKVGGVDYLTYELATISNNVDTEYLDVIPDSDLTIAGISYGRPDSTSQYITVNDTQVLKVSEHHTSLGLGAGQNARGAWGVYLGYRAGYNITTGLSNTLIGYDAGLDITTGSTSVMVGTYAGQNSNPRDAVLLGYQAGDGISTARYVVGIGRSALQNSTGYGNVAVGQAAGRDLTTGTYNVFLGYEAGDGVTQLATATNSIGIGKQVNTTKSNQVILGNDDITETLLKGNIGIGATSPTNILSLGGNVARIFWMERHTTANTAGNTLTVQAGGATSGATDKAGGDLILQPGVSTGSGESGVQVKGCVAGASGTADRTLTNAIQVLGNKIGFFAATPVVKQTYTAVSDPPTQAQVTAIRDALVNLGLMASS